jgi:hypothetical protein
MGSSFDCFLFSAERECSARLALQLCGFSTAPWFDGAAWMFSKTVFGAGPSLKRIVLFTARQEPAPLEKPQCL